MANARNIVSFFDRLAAAKGDGPVFYEFPGSQQTAVPDCKHLRYFSVVDEKSKGETMTYGKLTSFVLCIGVVAGITIGPAAAADKKAKEGQITGTVHMIDKDKSTLMVMKGTTQREVIYNSDTKWMRGTQGSNKPASLDDLKENWYINCEGKFDGVKLVASACRFREAK